jgi:hypothetical protein
MDESISLDLGIAGDTKIATLFESKRNEDQAIAAKAVGIMETILKEITPIISYVAVPILIAGHESAPTKITHWYGKGGAYNDKSDCYRLLPLGIPNGLLKDTLHKGRGELFLGAPPPNAPWLESFECQLPACVKANGQHYHGHITGMSLWAGCPFRVIIGRLNAALKEAQAKRMKHLAAIEKRISMLDAIEEVLKRY